MRFFQILLAFVGLAVTSPATLLIVGYVIPSLLCTVWTAHLLRCWKSNYYRRNLPFFASFHWATYTLSIRGWPTLGDATSRYLAGFIPGFNFFAVIFMAVLYVGHLPGVIFKGTGLAEFFRRPLKG